MALLVPLSPDPRRTSPWLAIAAGLSLVGVGASCSLLLDTGSLQGGSPGSSGTTGTSTAGTTATTSASSGNSTSTTATGGADAGDTTTTASSSSTSTGSTSTSTGTGSGSTTSTAGSDGGPDAGRTCTGDGDCYESPDNPCTVNVCDTATHLCRDATPWHGMGLSAIDSMPVLVVDADDIGLPVLAADDSFITLAYWQTKGGSPNITVRHYDSQSGNSPVDINLSALLPGFSGWASSPGILPKSTGLLTRGVRLLFAATAADAGAPGMQVVDLTFSAGNTTLAPPIMPNVGGSYTADPRISAPRIMTWPMQEGALWLSDGNLYGYSFAAGGMPQGRLVYDKTSYGKQVMGFGPIEATSGLHAVIQTTDGTGQFAQLWTEGSLATVSLGGDLPVRHFGITASSLDEGIYALAPLSLIAWSQGMDPLRAQMFSAAAECLGATCGAAAFGEGDAPPSAGVFPLLVSNRSATNTAERYIGQAFSNVVPNPQDMTLVDVTLVAAISRVTVAGGDPAVQVSGANPPAVGVTAGSVPAVSKMADGWAQAAVVVTPRGQMMVAWVEHPNPQHTLLFTRRFATKECN